MDIKIRRAAKKDIGGIYNVEIHSFLTPWSIDSFNFDICENGLAIYVVALERKKVVGFGGMHYILDEGHIMNLAVLKEYRGMRIGEALMKKLFELAPPEVENYTLEVRVSNTPAIRLYEKLGFKGAGVRRGYYQDTGEDALIMWLKNA